MAAIQQRLTVVRNSSDGEWLGHRNIGTGRLGHSNSDTGWLRYCSSEDGRDAAVSVTEGGQSLKGDGLGGGGGRGGVGVGRGEAARA